jgi:hypothetical protein
VSTEDSPLLLRADVCEWQGCWEKATYNVHGAWTIFDWIDVQVCSGHVLEVKAWMLRRTVDNYFPEEVYATRYW